MDISDHFLLNLNNMICYIYLFMLIVYLTHMNEMNNKSTLVLVQVERFNVLRSATLMKPVLNVSFEVK